MRGPEAVSRGREGRRRRGQALAAALVMLVFMAALLGSLSMVLTYEARLAIGQSDHVQAMYAAQAGLETGLAMLAKDDREADTLLDPWARGDWQTGQAGEHPFVVGTWPADSDPAPGGIIDEERKLNVNHAEPRMLAAVHPALTQEMIDRLLIRRRRKPLVMVEEILALPGASRDTLDTSDEDGLTLRDVVTVHGEGRVNVCTAPQRVLQALGLLSDDVIAAILEHRAGPDGMQGTADDRAISSPPELTEVAGLTGEQLGRLTPWICVSSGHFRVQCVGRPREGSRTYVRLAQLVRRDDSGLAVLRLDELH